MRAFLSTVIWTIKDDRFSWRFKLCNILTNDRLRWETAVITLHADNYRREAYALDNPRAKHMIRRAEKILECADNIFHM